MNGLFLHKYNIYFEILKDVATIPKGIYSSIKSNFTSVCRFKDMLRIKKDFMFILVNPVIFRRFCHGGGSVTVHMQQLEAPIMGEESDRLMMWKYCTQVV